MSKAPAAAAVKAKPAVGAPVAAAAHAHGAPAGAARRSSGEDGGDDGDSVGSVNTNHAPSLTRADLLKPVASLNDASAANKSALLIHKLRLCSVLFDWNDSTGATPEQVQRDGRAKEVKRQQLLELVEYIGKNKNIYTEQVLQEIVNMVRRTHAHACMRTRAWERTHATLDPARLAAVEPARGRTTYELAYL